MKMEAELFCRSCRWLERRQALPAIIDKHSADDAIEIWCTMFSIETAASDHASPLDA